MALVLWIVGFAALVFAWKKLIAYAIDRKNFIQAIDRFDGPPAVPILGCAAYFKFGVDDFTDQIFEYANLFVAKSAGAIRLWLGPYAIVCVLKPDYVRCVLESQKLLTKGIEYGIIERWLGTGLLTSTGSKWKLRRKMLTPAFHFTMLRSFLRVYDEEARILVREIEKHADTDEIFDFFPYAKRCALDVICETSMGVKISAQTNIHHPYVQGVHRLSELSFDYTRLPWLWLRPIWYGTGKGAEYDSVLRLVTDFTREVIERRGREFREKHARGEVIDFSDEKVVHGAAKKKLAFLDLLLSVQANEKDGLTDEDIREEVDTFMFEGHDTTSSAMAWTIWALAHHGECQAKVIEEVDQVFGDSDRDVSHEDLPRLKYLEWCIKEALRLYPPVPFFTRHVEEPFDLQGTLVPAGATIMVPPLIIHRDSEFFPSPHSYNPERFNSDAVAQRHAFAFVPFSGGPRNCIGQKFALMEEKTVLSWFFRRYRVAADRPWADNKPLPEIITKPSLGTPVRIYQRRSRVEK